MYAFYTYYVYIIPVTKYTLWRVDPLVIPETMLGRFADIVVGNRPFLVSGGDLVS